VREVARDSDWRTTIKFFREIANQGQSQQDFAMLADLARRLGRRDLAVIAGTAAANAGVWGFRDLAFPLIPVHAGGNWTMVHAISRQESQFSQFATSRTNAKGLMQLMPATAAEQARKLGLPYAPGSLTTDPAFNIRLGDAYSRASSPASMALPLAVAAYNAGAAMCANGWPSAAIRAPMARSRHGWTGWSASRFPKHAPMSNMCWKTPSSMKQ
jgi:soluble lytic murein transglycosylase